MAESMGNVFITVLDNMQTAHQQLKGDIFIYLIFQIPLVSLFYKGLLIVEILTL